MALDHTEAVSLVLNPLQWAVAGSLEVSWQLVARASWHTWEGVRDTGVGGGGVQIMSVGGGACSWRTSSFVTTL